jgi:CHASE2 domain-containing sensor protein
MLSREDNRRLAELERQLRNEDPEFCARMEGAKTAIPSRRKRFPITLILTIVVILAAAAVLGVVGWWIPAAIAALCATMVATAMVIRARRLSKN